MKKYMNWISQILYTRFRRGSHDVGLLSTSCPYSNRTIMLWVDMYLKVLSCYVYTYDIYRGGGIGNWSTCASWWIRKISGNINTFLHKNSYSRLAQGGFSWLEEHI